MNSAQIHALLLHTGEHLVLVLTSVALALTIALPLGAGIAHKAQSRTILAALGMLYTVPSLALFALLVPLIGLGTLTAIVALTLYASIFLTRTVTIALQAVPPQIVEHALALGTTPMQRLLRIELPLASPAIIAGLRTTCIMLIATAGIAAWIDAGGLGVLLFEGLRQDDMQRVITGSTALAVMAIVFDGILSRVERYANLRLHLYK